MKRHTLRAYPQAVRVAMVVCCSGLAIAADQIPELTADVKIIIDAPADLQRSLKTQLTTRLMTLEGVRVVAADERYEMRIIGIPGPRLNADATYFLSVVTAPSPRDRVDSTRCEMDANGEFLERNDTDADGELTNWNDAAVMFLDRIDRHGIRQHFALVTSDSSLDESCDEIAARFDSDILVPQRRMLEFMKRGSEEFPRGN